MEILQNKNGSSLTVTLKGRLDTTTSPQLESELKTALPGVTELIFDFTSLDYISSAGLRVLLFSRKQMDKQGKMKVSHANEAILGVFDATGFSDILTIE